MNKLTTHIRRLIGELDYAQRRSLELQTGLPFTGPATPRRRHHREIERLNSALGQSTLD